VSLGIALDTSQSMSGEKIQAAKSALERFLTDLFGPDDEFFLYRFSDGPVLLQTWTSDRGLLSRALNRVVPSGRTAMFDTIADAVPLAQAGKNRKKALVVISDGNDTTSTTTIREVKQLIHESEALVYAVGIDCGAEGTDRLPQADPTRPQPQRRGPLPLPFPFPPGRGGIFRPPAPVPPPKGRAARHDRRQRRAHRNHPAGARPGSGDQRHRRRVEQAVLPGLPGERQEGRPLAFDPRGGEERHLS